MIAEVSAALDAALAARAQLRNRPIATTIASLAAATRAWAADGRLRTALAPDIDLDPTMLDHVLPLVADAIEPAALERLHAEEALPDGPALVGVVLASNVPALAVPAIVHACLAGAAVVVKSGRADPHSAPAFRDALLRIDPDLAATIVCAYWRGGTRDVEDAVLGQAQVVVVTGGDPATTALAGRLSGRVVTHGPRTSVAVLGPAPSDETLHGLALDVARHEQRGCLSPHTVLVVGGAAVVADRLARALERVAEKLPRRPAALEVRAAHRIVLEDARFAGASVLESPGGTVIVDPGAPRFDAPGLRTVRLHSIDDATRLQASIPPRQIECVGVDASVVLDVEALRHLGVARVCPIGRMQRPPVDWPRGQHPALGSLFRATGEPRIQVES